MAHPSGSKNNSLFSRRHFLATLGATATAAGIVGYHSPLFALGSASQVDITQLIYSGGNWQPRPTALRRLAFELQKRTAIDSVLEPTSSRPLLSKLATGPLLYMSGDRPFTQFQENTVTLMRRYLKNGGTLIVDPAYTSDGDSKGVENSLSLLFKELMPNQSPEKILPGHVIFRSFYDLNSASGKRKGSQGLVGYKIGDRHAIIKGDHDMGGAWAKDNMGNWEYEISGGARQRENAFRLGINLIMYALCGGYKNEMPHKRFSNETMKRK